MEYFTSLIDERGGPAKCKYVYSFGAPGHGKGPFDGLGGTIKKFIHGLITGTKTSLSEGIPGVECRYISNATDVFEAASAHFEGEEYHSRNKRKNRINKFKFFLHLVENNDILRPEEEHRPLDQITRNYQFVVRETGVMFMRKRSCWCLYCMKAMLDPTTTKMTVDGCTSTSNNTTTLYDFELAECKKVKGANVKKLSNEKKQSRTEMAERISIGDWMLFSSNDHEQPVWLGRAMAKREWGNSCKWKNDSKREQDLGNGVKIRRGGYAINVQWYTHTEVGSTQYRLDSDEPNPLVQSDIALLHAGFEMTQVVGRRAAVPRSRTRTRTRRGNDIDDGLSRPRMNLQTREGDWFRKDFHNVYVIDDADKNKALAERLLLPATLR